MGNEKNMKMYKALSFCLKKYYFQQSSLISHYSLNKTCIVFFLTLFDKLSPDEWCKNNGKQNKNKRNKDYSC